MYSRELNNNAAHYGSKMNSSNRRNDCGAVSLSKSNSVEREESYSAYNQTTARRRMEDVG